MSGGENHGREYEVNAQRAHWCGYVLVAGLVLELINAIIWYKGPETIAAMAAVLLIVGGVWGEIFFGHRARSAGDRQLAQYEARTAEAQLRAEQLRKAMAWRQLDEERFVAELRNAQEKPTVEIIYVDDDPESFHFAVDLQILIARERWPVTSPKAIRYKLIDGALIFPNMVVSPIGVTIGTHSLEEGEKDGSAFKALEGALLASLDSVQGVRAEGLSRDRLLVVVAPRA